MRYTPDQLDAIVTEVSKKTIHCPKCEGFGTFWQEESDEVVDCPLCLGAGDFQLSDLFAYIQEQSQ